MDTDIRTAFAAVSVEDSDVTTLSDWKLIVVE